MDSLMICASGHVGKVQGIGRDSHKRDIYRFSVATNFRHPVGTLWLQCTVVKQDLFQLCIERGLLTGDHVLIMADRADIRAVVKGNSALTFLNVEVSQMTFLTAPAVPQLEHSQDFHDRSTVIDYNQLMKQKVGA